MIVDISDCNLSFISIGKCKVRKFDSNQGKASKKFTEVYLSVTQEGYGYFRIVTAIFNKYLILKPI